jgi:hypothetical protein
VEEAAYKDVSQKCRTRLGVEEKSKKRRLIRNEFDKAIAQSERMLTWTFVLFAILFILNQLKSACSSGSMLC